MTTDRVIGLGEQLYSVELRWGELADQARLHEPSKLAVDSLACVYVFQRSDPAVVVFDGGGAYAGSFGDGLIADAHGICVTPGGGVVLVDRDAHEVLVFDSGWNLRRRIGERHRPNWQAPFNHPADVCSAHDGTIFVADGYGNSCIHSFSPEGELICSWGRPGRAPGEFSTPHGIAVDQLGRILVGDRENHRVQVFTPDGEYLEEWGPFTGPMDIWVAPDGMVFVSDGATNFETPHLSLLTPDGELVGRCRSPGLAHGIGGNARGELFLTGPLLQGVVKLTPLEA